MKTAKEKAYELYSTMLNKIEGLEGTDWWESAKQCAMAAVELFGEDNSYWQEVKQEIEKI
jgi:hypothetical protein